MSSTPSSADPARVDVWLARDPELRDPESTAGFARILTADEMQRVQRMQFDAGRHQQLVTRAMVRNVLSHYLPGVAPADWRFESGEQGRPAIAPGLPAAARALDFNLAHTEGLVAMAVGWTRVGVDAERVDPRVNLAVARRYFSAEESAALDALPPERRARRFQRLWTLKEAYLKALGTGIAGGLGSMTFHFDAADVPRFERANDPEAARWIFRELESGDHHVAIAVLGAAAAPAPVITLREYPRDLR
jgi:4'-phosphopantetheinyl transferase